MPPLGRTASRPLRFDEMPRGRLLVRAVGIDSAGHRVAAWTTLDLSTAAWRPTRSG